MKIRAKYTRERPSPRFTELLEQYRAMHRNGDPAKGIAAKQMFDGRSLAPHIRHIKALIARTGASTILDYGSGKGRQYLPIEIAEGGAVRWNSIQAYWGVSAIKCYDPGYEPLAALPQGKFDGVVCTDVLEHCPEQDLGWIVGELFAFADRFVYANVACYPAAKTLPNGENAHCTIRPVDFWRELFEAAGADRPAILWELRAETPRGNALAEVRHANFAAA